MLEVTKSSLFVSRMEHFRSRISIKGGLGETVNQFPCYWSISVEMNMLKNFFLPAFHDKKFWSIRMWRHQQTEKRACETRRRCVKNVVFILLMDSLCRVRNIIMYVLSRRTVSVLTRVLFGVYFPRYFATREINNKITLSWALKQSVPQVHTLFSMYSFVIFWTHTHMSTRDYFRFPLSL